MQNTFLLTVVPARGEATPSLQIGQTFYNGSTLSGCTLDELNEFRAALTETIIDTQDRLSLIGQFAGFLFSDKVAKPILERRLSMSMQLLRLAEQEVFERYKYLMV